MTLSTQERAVDLASYQAWLRRRGAGAGTIRQYSARAVHLLAGVDPFDQLTDRKLSPKYRRFLKAAALSFAKFSQDGKLIAELSELRLPAPVRKTAKVPLSESGWRALRSAIDSSGEIDDPTRAVLGIMITRGLRSGDVLRLHRQEITDALKTSALSFIAKGERRLEFGVQESWEGYLELLRDAFVGTRAVHVWSLISPDAKNPATSASLAVLRSLRRVGEELGERKLGISVEELHPHLLRRSVASFFYVAGGRDPMRLKNWMQWSSLETAMGYADHTKREELDAIADEMLK
jgi:integrase